MEYRQYRDTDQNVSLLGLGCMRFPRTGVGEQVDEAKAEAIIDHAYKNGINYFDTAYLYNAGDSERVTGKALSKYPRDSYLLATKLPWMKLNSRQEVLDTFQEQLDRCGVEYFDFYLCHDVKSSSVDLFYQDFVLETLIELKAQGKIRRLGFSSHGTPDLLEKFADYYAWDFAQIQLNYFDWSYQDAKQQYEILRERNIPIIVMEPLRGGRLADMSPELAQEFKARDAESSVASWGLRYLAQMPGILTVLSGMSDLEQLQDNLNTMSSVKPLTEEEVDFLYGMAEKLKAHLLLPCTGCRYCIDCPQGLDIPTLLSIYNMYSLTHMHFDLISTYKLPADKQPGSCIDCGQCVEHCPQGIDIPAAMRALDQFLKDNEEALKNM